MADPRTTAPNPVAGLIDIPLPREVSFWPQTWEARTAVLVLMVALVAVSWRFARDRHVNRYRREALAELARIERAGGDPSELLDQVALLVRRVALAAFPRPRVVSLVGPAWLAFLDRSYGGHGFSIGVGHLLGRGPYQPAAPDEAQMRALADLVRRWISPDFSQG